MVQWNHCKTSHRLEAKPGTAKLQQYQQYRSLTTYPPMLLAHRRGAFVRLYCICGHGRSAARCPCRIQSAKARFTGQ